MKKISLFFTTFLVFACILSGCKGISDYSSDNTVKVSFGIKESAARTALPDVSYDGLQYELKGKLSSEAEEEVYIEKTSIGNLTVKMIQGTYDFTLTAYDSENTVLFEGTEKNVTLNESNKTVIFTLYPKAEGKGRINISLKFPDDGVITSVKAGISGSRTLAPSDWETLTIGSAGDSKRIVSLIKTDISAGEKHYAFFNCYDSQNALIYSCVESIYMVANRESKSEMEITSASYNTGAVSVSLNLDSAAYAVGSVTARTADGKEYVLTNNGDGTYSASVPNGSYSVVLAGTPEEVVVGTLNTEAGNSEAEINLVTVTPDSETLKHAVLTESSGVVAKAGNGFIVPAGSDFEVSVVLNPGYKAEDGSEVTIGGKTVQGGKVTLNSATSVISSENIDCQDYTINYVDSENGGNAVSWNGFTPVTTYNVETAVTLPSADNVNTGSYVFLGWTETDDGNEIVTEIPVGTTGNKTFYVKRGSDLTRTYKVQIWTEKADSTDASLESNYEIDTRNLSGIKDSAINLTPYIETRTGFKAAITGGASTIGDGNDSVAFVKYQRNSYTVTFRANGGFWDYNSETGTGSDAADKVIEQKYGSTFAKPSVAALGKLNYRFDGWKKNNAGELISNEAISTVINSEDVSYYAQWTQDKADYTVQFWFEKLDSDAFEQKAGLPQFVNKTMKGDYPSSVTYSKALCPALEGFIVQDPASYELKADGTTVVRVEYKRRLVTFRYDLNNASVNNEAKWENDSTEVRSVETNRKYGSAVTKPANPANTTHYDFTGWSPEVPSTYPDVTGVQTFYAQWTKARTDYSVEYYHDGVLLGDGSVDPAWPKGSTGVAIGSAVNITASQLVNIPAGWKLAENGIKNIASLVDGINVVKIYFETKSYEVTFDANSGNWTADYLQSLPEGNVAVGTSVIKETLRHGSPIVKPGTEPVRNGYHFAGWSPEVPANCSGTASYSAQWIPWYEVETGTGDIFADAGISILNENGVLSVANMPADTTGWTFQWYDYTAGRNLGTGSTVTATTANGFAVGRHTIAVLVTNTASGLTYSAQITVTIR